MKESTTKQEADILNFHNIAALEASRALQYKAPKHWFRKSFKNINSLYFELLSNSNL